jgi:protoporphyrin/coproporphyrin ferrochelatase
MDYDALLVVSFGGPEKPDDVIPFLETVLKGRNVPRARLEAVAEHYFHFGGKSPINDQCRALIKALETDLAQYGPRLPIYWGNRNWHPFLTDTVRRMRDDGVKKALAFVTTAYSSYSSCRQYVENIALARERVGPGAPEIHKLPAFYNSSGFIIAMADRVRDALDQLPGAALVYTAHSIPKAMADASEYERQLIEASRLTSEVVGRSDWMLVYQSRSGPPTQPWLGPDVCDFLREVRPAKVVLVPIGFISDHMEVVYDLDTEARAVCDELGIQMVRAKTAGTHPRFVKMIREMVAVGRPSSCNQGCCERGY